jgi:hypothetical protein
VNRADLPWHEPAGRGRQAIGALPKSAGFDLAVAAIEDPNFLPGLAIDQEWPSCQNPAGA